MTLDELRRVEKTLGLTLPFTYKAFMLEFPTALLETGYGSGNGGYIPAEWEFLGSAEQLIENNCFVRNENEEIEWMSDGSPWPADKFVIGLDIGGDYFAIDLSGEGGVFRYCHEDGSLEPLEPTLHDYMQRVLQNYAKSAS